jgi:hypothetical protein
MSAEQPAPDQGRRLVGQLRELLAKVHEAPLFYDTCAIASEAWRDKNGMIHYEAYGGPLAEGDPRTMRLCVAAVNALPALLEIAEAARDYIESQWDVGGASFEKRARLCVALSLLPSTQADMAGGGKP